MFSSAAADKRKKSGSKTRKSREKDATPSRNTVVTIRVQQPDAAVDPLVVSFPGGVPEYHKNTKPKFLWRKLKPTSLSGRLLKGQDADGTCQYLASCQGMGYDDRKTKLCVGVLDKQTNTLTLHQAASKGTVYTLQQGIPQYKETGLVDQADMAFSSLLFEDFGSAKKRKVLRSRKANKVDVSTVLGAGEAAAEQMKGTMSASNQLAVAASSRNAMVDPVQAAHDEARRAMLPPFDEKATEAWDVYKPKDMVRGTGAGADHEAWRGICRVVTACIHQAKIADAFIRPPPSRQPQEGDQEEFVERPPEKRGWAPSVVAVFRTLEDAYHKATDQTDTLEKQFQCALLLHYLVMFYSRFFQGGSGRQRTVGGLVDTKSNWFGIPKPVAQHFLETMATEQIQRQRQQRLMLGEEDNEDKKKRDAKKPALDLSNVPTYIMTKANQDKCAVSILLVYLMAKGGPTMVANDVSPLIDDLAGMDAKSVTHLLRQAGCTVKSTPAKKRLQASLTVPLTFPSVRAGGNKRKR